MSGDGFQTPPDDPVDEAPTKPRKAKDIPGAPKWFERKEGLPVGSYRNAQAALRAIGAAFAFNEFRQRSTVQWGGTNGGEVADISDRALFALRKAIADRFGFDPQSEHLRDAALTMCYERSYDPVLNYLDNLIWDRRPRLDRWLTTYLDAKDNALTREFGRKTLIAGVRRVRQPGCKFDTVLVLEGEQGRGKSTALAILAGDLEYFTDQDIFHLPSKEQRENIAGKWIVELAELAGLRRTENERSKSFITRQFDRGRNAYARFGGDQPRRCVMIGTTNPDEYLNDPTGNRRFWPVKVGSVDLKALRRDRDQLWAEAAYAEAADEGLTLDPELYADAGARQAARLEFDPWEDKLATLRPHGHALNGQNGGIVIEAGIEKIFSKDVMNFDALGIPPERQTSAQARRIAAAMRKLGWDAPTVIRIDKVPGRGFQRRQRKAGDENDKKINGVTDDTDA